MTRILEPKVVQTYRLTPLAVGYDVNGLTLVHSGNALVDRPAFDVIEALRLAGGEELSVCDNSLKRVLDECEWLERVA